MLAQDEKKNHVSQPTEPFQANLDVHTATPSAETFCQLIFKEIIVNSCTSDSTFGALGCTATAPALPNAWYLRADQENSAPGTWVTSLSYILRCKGGVRHGALSDQCCPCAEPAWAASALPCWSPGEHLHGYPRA